MECGIVFTKLRYVESEKVQVLVAQSCLTLQPHGL